MMTVDDINRFVGDRNLQERRINNAMMTCKNSTEEWPKAFWYDVFLKLCKQYNRMDLYNKHLH